MQFRTRAATLACALLSLTGCEVRSYLDVDLADPTAGTVEVQLGFDQEVRRAVEQVGGGADLLGFLAEDAPGAGWQVEPFMEGPLEGVVLSRSFASVTELQGILTESMASGPQGAALGVMTFTDDGDIVRFEASPAAGGASGPIDLATLPGLFEYDARVRVTFPGEVLEHNGQLEGNTVTWVFDDPADLAGAELFAEARRGRGIPFVVTVLALTGGAGAALVAMRFRRARAGQPTSESG